MYLLVVGLVRVRLELLLSQPFKRFSISSLPLELQVWPHSLHTFSFPSLFFGLMDCPWGIVPGDPRFVFSYFITYVHMYFLVYNCKAFEDHLPGPVVSRKELFKNPLWSEEQESTCQICIELFGFKTPLFVKSEQKKNSSLAKPGELQVSKQSEFLSWHQQESSSNRFNKLFW